MKYCTGLQTSVMRNRFYYIPADDTKYL